MANAIVMPAAATKVHERFEVETFRPETTSHCTAEMTAEDQWRHDDLVAARAIVGIMSAIFFAALALYGGIAIYIGTGGR